MPLGSKSGRSTRRLFDEFRSLFMTNTSKTNMPAASDLFLARLTVSAEGLRTTSPIPRKAKCGPVDTGLLPTVADNDALFVTKGSGNVANAHAGAGTSKKCAILFTQNSLARTLRP